MTATYQNTETTMMLIEPCCTQKHWPMLKNSIGDNGTEWFHGYGDLSFSELLPVILLHYNEVDMTLVAPSIPDIVSDILKNWMNMKRVKMDGSGKIQVISRLTIITSLSEKKSPVAASWMKCNPWGERLVLKNVQQNNTAIILPDMAIYGPINMTYGHHFVAAVTKDKGMIEMLRNTYKEICR